MIKLLLASLIAHGSELNVPETSYTGATILQGDMDVVFDEVLNINYEPSSYAYAFFEGNTLYAGISDEYDNSVDSIVEFFWFESSIDRGSDFYVAVVKVRATPGNSCPWYMGGTECELWADDWADFGEHPVVTVEAITDVTREQGAFRWDWAVPFENYGIDAYGQMSFSNQYGIGGATDAGTEGSAMTAVTIPEGTNINGIPVEGGVNVEASVQTKGFVSSEYKVQTQYDVMLYEWDVYVNGRADLMAWDTYLNLGVRARQSAYYEYFLPIQVEIGHTFKLDELNFVSNYDIGDINPFAHELGMSIQNLEIGAPLWIPPEEEPEEEPEPSSEPEEPAETDTGIEEPIEETEEEDEPLELERESSQPVKSCSTATSSNTLFVGLLSGLLVAWRRRK